MSKERKLPPLEEGLLKALRALDNQIARQMERSPTERAERGVQKWEPYQSKIEEVCALLMNGIGDEELRLDGVLVAAQALTKSLYLISEELGEVGLGKLRSAYCRDAFEAIIRDAERGLRIFGDEGAALN
ncbi:MAG: hypothetical protein KDD69_03685 [Bdellovibrionales bacterium]|nr:hypothetical protein [Bdellovibrionales bacterium]